MRYHYQKPDIYRSMYGETYICNHPVYNKCTLFRIGDNGLAVIQQRFNAETKSTWWVRAKIHEQFRFEIYTKTNGVMEAVLPDMELDIRYALPSEEES